MTNRLNENELNESEKKIEKETQDQGSLFLWLLTNWIILLIVFLIILFFFTNS